MTAMLNATPPPANERGARDADTSWIGHRPEPLRSRAPAVVRPSFFMVVEAPLPSGCRGHLVAQRANLVVVALHAFVLLLHDAHHVRGQRLLERIAIARERCVLAALAFVQHLLVAI